MRKCLYIDIETAPSVAYIYKLWQETIPLDRLRESGRMICFSAKWHGDRRVQFYSEHNVGRDEMLSAAHDLLTEADVVVHYNGKRFDVPMLNREFLVAGMGPPAPYQQLDLYKEVRKTFKFDSNKLDHVAQQLEIGQKVKHSGFKLWLGCMAGDAKAWREMEKYNKQDVKLLEDLYLQLRPWISSHPHVGLYDGGDLAACPRCGSTNFKRNGNAYTQQGRYQRWFCHDCKGYSRATKRLDGAEMRPV